MNKNRDRYDAVLAMLALCVLMDSCFATDANSTVSNGTLLDATDDNEVSYAGVSFNYDKHVEEMMSRFLPATHKPFITQNIIWAFAELYTILNVNEVSETITTKLWIYQSYSLQNLDHATWVKYLGHQVSQVTPDPKTMWKPDLVILNSAESFESWSRPVITLYCEEYDNTSNQSGRCIRSYPLVVFPYALTETTRCVFDVTDFPFDSQKCHIDLGPWYTSLLPGPTGMPDSLSTPYFVFHPNEGSNETDMSLSAYTPSSQWEVEKVTRERRTRRAYMGRLSEFMLLRYTIHMNRRPTFFINTLLLPCLILTLLTVLSVFLPVESGEKISLGITIMLAQVVNLLILSSILPASSLHFPVLGRYFLVTIGLIGLSLVYNCAITNYFYNDHISILRKLFDLLTVLSVFLPVESGEKISLGITIMLAQVVNLLILSSILPASSLHFPVLGFFIIISKDPGENVKSANFENNTKNLNETGDGAYENEAVLERSETGLSNSRCSVLKGSDSEESDQSNARRKISASCDMGFGIFMLVFIAVIHVLFFWKHVVT